MYQDRPSFIAFLRPRWRETGSSGRLHAARGVFADLWQFVRDSTPGRRRSRYGDLDFDFESHLNTSAGNVSARDRLLGAAAGGPYQPSDPELFRTTLGELPIRYEDFVFLDL